MSTTPNTLNSEASTSSGESTFRPAMKLIIGRLASFAVTFITPVLLVRVFNQAEFGTYKQFLLITYTPYLIGCAFSECLFYFVPKDPARGGRYAMNSLLMLCATALLCFIGMIPNSSRIARMMNNPALAPYVPMVALYLFFMLMGTVLEITMISRKRYGLAAVTYVVSDVLRAAFLVIPAVITRNLAWAIGASVVFFALRAAAVFGYLRWDFGGTVGVDKQLMKEQWNYAAPYSLSAIVQVIQQNYHQYAVAYYFDPGAFAVYSVGSVQVPLVEIMGTPTSNVMMVRMTESLRDGKTETLLPIWRDTTRKLALLFCPLVGVLLVAAYPLITLLYTTAYAASVPLFMVWCVRILLSIFQTDGVLRVFAQIRFLFEINLVRLGILMLLTGWCLSTFGLMGAVLVTLFVMFDAKLMGLIRIRKLLNVTYRELLPWRDLGGALIASAVAMAPAAGVQMVLKAPAIVTLFASSAVYSAAYALAVLMFGLISGAERAGIKAILYNRSRGAAQAISRAVRT